MAQIVAFLLRLEVFNSLLKSYFGCGPGSTWLLKPHYLLPVALLAPDASPSGQKKYLDRLSNFCASCVLLCLFHDCDIAVLTSWEETHILGPSNPLKALSLLPRFSSTSPLCIPKSPTNCARQPLLGLPAEQDRPVSLASSWMERVAEQRALSEHCQAPEDSACCRPLHRAPSLHLCRFPFGPERASEIRLSEMQ